jgi:sigma-E factor negative regulatory protein RseA
MTDAMQPNEMLQSQLSAFIDDELPSAETELLVRRLVKDQELKQSMARYLWLGEALRNPAAGAAQNPIVSRDFSQRIASALEQDAAAAKVATESKSAQVWPQWLKPVAGMALAASVALVAVINLRQPTTDPSLAADNLQPVMLTAQRPNAINGAANSYVVPSAANAPTAPIPVARLTNYVVAHSEFSSPLGRRNMLTGLLASDQNTDQNTDQNSNQAAVSQPAAEPASTTARAE